MEKTEIGKKKEFPIKVEKKTLKLSEKFETEIICQKFSNTYHVYIIQNKKPGMIIIGKKDSEDIEKVDDETYDIDIIFGKRKYDEDNECLIEELIVRNIVEKCGNVYLWTGLKKEYIQLISDSKKDFIQLTNSVNEVLKNILK